MAWAVARMTAVKVTGAVLRVALVGLVLGGCGSRTGVQIDDSSLATDAGTNVNVDADLVGVVVCTVPVNPHRGNGGQCTLCNGLYYCPEWPPSPPCAPGLQLYGSCTTTCIACGDGVQESEAQNDAWLWGCTNGSYVPPY